MKTTNLTWDEAKDYCREHKRGFGLGGLGLVDATVCVNEPLGVAMSIYDNLAGLDDEASIFRIDVAGSKLTVSTPEMKASTNWRVK